MKLSDLEIAELQTKYNYLVNYASTDIDDPIDPLTYVDSNGDTLLHIAASNGDVRSVELLLKAGLNIDQLGDMGCTALHYATLSNHKDVANVLVRNGASLSIRNEFGKLPDE